MKARLYAASAVMVVVAMLFTLNAGAQGQPVSEGEYRTIIVTSPDEDLPVPYSVPVGPASEVSGQAIGVADLSFTPSLFAGHTGIAYGSDQGTPDYAHIYYSHGIHATGTELWVAEKWGLRVLRYDTNTLQGNLRIGVGGQRVKVGRIASQDRFFDSPGDVATDGAGHLYVADSVSHQVFKFDLNQLNNPSTGGIVGVLGVPYDPGDDNAHFNEPISVAVDSSGNLYVSDLQNDRIQIFNSSLTHIGQITGLNEPHHIYINGNLLFVADSGNHRIVVYDITNPEAPVQSGAPIGSFGTGNGQFNYPEGVASDGTRVFVADTYNNRVQIFDRTDPNNPVYMATLGAQGQTGTGNDRFVRPTDVALDGAGNLYVADPRNNHRVQKFVPAMDPPFFTYVDTVGTTQEPYVPGSNL